MRAITLKNKYPEIWMNVYTGMIHDLCECMQGSDIQLYHENNKKCRIERIAHNAAFLACYEIHKLGK